MLNVLIVDDCDLVRSICVKTLRLARFPVNEVYQASNGREALEIVSERWVDLVLADLNMPVMDGVRMIEHFEDRGILKSVPVVVISTEGSATRVQELLRRGVAGYLRKPFTPESMRDVVTRAVGYPDGTAYHDQLALTFSQVVEDFALMLGVRADECSADVDTTGWVQAKLAFRGAYSGSLVAAAPRALVREIAANALGLDADDSDTARYAPEALKEVANVTCGRLVTDIAGEAAVIELSAPTLGPYNAADWGQEHGRSTIGFSVEGMPISLAVNVRTCAV